MVEPCTETGSSSATGVSVPVLVLVSAPAVLLPDLPFAEPGLTDLTAHVDFTAARLLAEERGFAAEPLVTQQEFLMAAGLEAELQALQASPDLTFTEYVRARSGIVRMLDPRHMGRFRVLIGRRGARDSA